MMKSATCSILIILASFWTLAVTAVDDEADGNPCLESHDDDIRDGRMLRGTFILYGDGISPGATVGIALGSFAGLCLLRFLCSGIDCSDNTAHDTVHPNNNTANVAKAAAMAHALWVKATLLAMIHVMLADGRVDDEEISVIKDQLEKLSGVTIEKKDIESMAAEVTEKVDGGGGVKEYLEPFAELLSVEGKENTITAMVYVAGADRNFDQREKDVISEAAEALGINDEHKVRTIKSAVIMQKAEREAGKPVPPKGAAVKITGLVAKPELNGKSGVVTGFDPETGRCNVRLETGGTDVEEGGGLGQVVAVKVSNLG